jgi:protein-tyrosine phosphatase
MSAAPFRILFVCLGNICRSPAAHAVMQAMVEKAGLSQHIQVDSAGTAGWHTGKMPDERMRRAGQTRGYRLDHPARQFLAADLARHDLILAMDRANRRDILAHDPENLFSQKVRLFCEFCTQHEEAEVPDPYYGGPEGFEHVLDLIEDGCRGILQEAKRHLPDGGGS